jgi:hypothetical protein
MAAMDQENDLIESRFKSVQEEAFTYLICEHLSRETNIQFDVLFYNENIIEYIREIPNTRSVQLIESMELYINTRVDRFKRHDELYEMITGQPISEETLQSRLTMFIADYHRLSETKCRNDYDKQMEDFHKHGPQFIEW